MGTGYLIIETRTGGQAIPVAGAQVQVKEAGGDSIYQNLVTDSNGQTSQISLKTADRALTLDPDYSGHPYASYELIVEAKGYDTVHLTGVHIFDGELSVQPVMLIPMLDEENKAEQLDIRIGEIAVEIEEGIREQEGPAIDSRILRHVIIPDTIIVHLGTPASSARDVKVAFADYVKNVACSEIYPTWPQASLEANIYVIITFALNRIFTEWYRSRGYSFDITNSTAYDQYYVVGQTIHNKVSVIVDRIFNQYVRRPEQYAPFFTSFCNGTTSTCSGLSQWGTVTLANNGLSALQILRHYYPNDVEIVESTIFTSYVESYPGTALRRGDRGADVETIQRQLGRIRRNYPLIPVITDAPGVFGDSTYAAVRTYQGVFSLTVDGIVGRGTWYSISRIYGAVSKLSELDGEGETIGITRTPPSTMLRQGDSGMDVVTLQYVLNYLSTYYQDIPEVTQNGIFGADTTRAVTAFQKMMGLTADGVVGNGTWSKLYDTYWSIRDNVIEPPVEIPDISEYIVQAGDTLYLIAMRFGTTVNEIKRLNHLTTDTIYVGQVLQLPVEEENTASFMYTVQSGDSLYLLARKFETTVADIKKMNSLTGDTIYVGQILQIPGTIKTHTVQSGESLFLLANRYGTTVDAIMKLNNLTDTVIYIQQVLLIP